MSSRFFRKLLYHEVECLFLKSANNPCLYRRYPQCLFAKIATISKIWARSDSRSFVWWYRYRPLLISKIYDDIPTVKADAVVCPRLQKKLTVELKRPRLNWSIKPSSLTRVLSVHLPGWCTWRMPKLVFSMFMCVASVLPIQPGKPAFWYSSSHSFNSLRVKGILTYLGWRNFAPNSTNLWEKTQLRPWQCMCFPQDHQISIRIRGTEDFLRPIIQMADDTFAFFIDSLFFVTFLHVKMGSITSESFSSSRIWCKR